MGQVQRPEDGALALTEYGTATRDAPVDPIAGDTRAMSKNDQLLRRDGLAGVGISSDASIPCACALRQVRWTRCVWRGGAPRIRKLRLQQRYARSGLAYRRRSRAYTQGVPCIVYWLARASCPSTMVDASGAWSSHRDCRMCGRRREDQERAASDDKRRMAVCRL